MQFFGNEWSGGKAEAVLEVMDFDGDGKMNFNEFCTIALFGK